MLYELITAEVRPGTLGSAVQQVAEAAAGRAGTSGLLGCWTTEIGQVNEIVALATAPERALDAGEREPGHWLTNAVESFAVATRLEHLRLFPFLPAIHPGSYGRVYELRSYVMKPGTTQETIERWEKALPRRMEMSRILGAFHGVSGSLQKFVHIWPYASADERLRIRTEAVAAGIWPPKGGAERLLHMQSSLLIPTAFSPLR
jgi:hypothetical protein